jgi:hypothetical protein
MQQRIPGSALDRREFLKGGAAALVVAGVSPWLVGASAGGTSAPFTRAEYEAFTGQWFQVGGPAGVPLQLVAVEDGPASAVLDQYTLRFRGGPGATLEEGTYEVSPPSGSPLPMFLQPGGYDGSEPRLHASFVEFRPLGPAACAPGAA